MATTHNQQYTSRFQPKARIDTIRVPVAIYYIDGLGTYDDKYNQHIKESVRTWVSGERAQWLRSIGADLIEVSKEDIQLFQSQRMIIATMLPEQMTEYVLRFGTELDKIGKI